MKYFAAVVIIVLILGGVFSLISFNQPSRQEQNNNPSTQRQEAQVPNSVESKLIIEDIKTGGGAEAKTGNTLSVNYVGTLLDGTKFDSSYDRGQSFSFGLGQGQVIPGWDQGILGMKVGGKRKLTIPPSLAYEANGVPGAIPPNSTLVFEVELIGVK